jgi:hypothetical protein
MQKYKRKPSTHKSWRWPIPLNLRIVRRVRLADQGIYLASESTFYRILKAARQLKHRRSERPHQPRTKPKALSATAPG